MAAGKVGGHGCRRSELRLKKKKKTKRKQLGIDGEWTLKEFLEMKEGFVKANFD